MMSILRTAAIGATFAAATLIASCSKDPETTPETNNPTPVAITLNEATPTTITVTFVPDDPMYIYFPHIIRKEAFEKDWGGDVARYTASYIDNYLRKQYPDKTRQQIVEDHIHTSGEYRYSHVKLQPDTEYLAFVVGVDQQGVPTTKPLYKVIKTKTVVTYDVTFGISVSEISLTRANFAFVPSKKDLKYLSGVALASQYPTDKAEQAEFAQVFADLMIDNAAAYYAINRLDAIPYISVSGDKEKALEAGSLQPNKEYIAITVGIDPSGVVNTAPSVKNFKTLPPNTSNNTFTANIDKTAVGASVTVTPANNDTYYVRVFTAAALQGISDAHIVATLSASGAAKSIISGTQTVDTWKDTLIPNTDYQLVIYGCDEWATTPVKRIPFKTSVGGDPSKCTFDISYSFKNVRTYYSVTPSDNTVFYYCQHEKTAELPTDQVIIDAVNDDLQMILNEDNGEMEPEEVLQILYNRAHLDSTFVCLPRTDYTIFSVPIDVATFTVASTKVTKVQFTTPKRTISTADISITDKRYYDLDELAAYDPATYGEYQGRKMALGKITVAPKNANAVKWYVDIFGGDLSSSSEEAIINNLIAHGKPLEGNVRFCEIIYNEAGIPNTICYIAADADENLGVLHREVWSPERSGKSPIEEFIGIPQGAAVRIPYRSAVVEPAAAPGSSLLERYKAAKASGALRQAASAKASAASATDPATEFSAHAQNDFIGFIR